MFQFSPLASIRLCIQRRMTAYYRCRVSPFGHLRITAYVRLPEAFRSLSRPSSPVRAKASTVRPFPLDRICSMPIDPEVHGQGTPAHRQRCSFSAFATPYPFTHIVNDSSFGGGANYVRSTHECLSAPKGLLGFL
jgi:hypothetical protein